MELPKRAKGDEFAPAGRYGELESQVRRYAKGRDLPALFVYAFDHRTRLVPFLFFDKMVIPGAPLSVGASLHAAGFENVRLVLQQWTPRVRPSQARINGRPPELLLVSSMQIHSAAAYELIRDAWRLGEARPLVLAGGPKAIYEPWDFFALSPDGRVAADAVVTGESLVLLELLERILAHQRQRETLRAAFDRVRREGLLNDIPGLVYRDDDGVGAPAHLVDTGTQRLVQDLDELPLPFDALGLFERRHRRTTLADRPVPAAKLSRHGSVMTIVTTHGCKFRCEYCPIPAYNQFTWRVKSPQRVVDEIAGTRLRSGIGRFFGADDNFFNNRQSVEDLFTAMAGARVGRKPFRNGIGFATEATEFDVFKHRDLLPLARDAGLRFIWFGVEDITATLINKGQTPEKTKALFQLLLSHGIGPMPMMMHHDGQPAWSRGSVYGLLNQVNYLRRAGALTFQVTCLTPLAGTRTFDTAHAEGIVIDQVGGRPIEDRHCDGNHCIASRQPRPWRMQWNLLASYLFFYNPVSFLRSALKFDRLWYFRLYFQFLGNLSVARSVFKHVAWIWRLCRGPIKKRHNVPRPKFPLIAADQVGRQGSASAASEFAK